MANPTTSARSRSPLGDLGVSLGVLAGAALTVVGWLRVEPGTWTQADHVTWFLWFWGFTAFTTFALGLRPLAAGAALLLVVALGTGNFGALLAVLALAWSATVLGRLVLAGMREASDLEGLLVGLAVHGTVVGFLVHFPVNYAATYTALLAAPLLVRRGDAARVLRERWQEMRDSGERAPGTGLFGSAAAALAAVHLCVALMPETGHDALVTHLLLPARIAWDHVWHFDVDRYVWAVMPMIGDWLYTIGHVLAGEAGARLVNFGGILLVARLIHACVTWAGGDRLGATVAVLLYLSTPLTLTETSSLFIESVWSCLVLGGALSLFRMVSRTNEGPLRSTHHLVVGGLLLGGALAAKAVTFMVLPVLFLVLVFGHRRWLRRDCVPALVSGGLGFLAIGAAPYVRAYVMTGNPVFPFYNATFRSPHYALEDFQPPDVFEKGTSWDVLYRITFDSMHFLEARAGAAGFQWLLLVAPVAIGLLLARHRRGALLLTVAAAALWMTFRQTAYLRYVFPSFALAAAAVGLGLTLVGPATRRLLLATTIVVVGLNLYRFDCAGYYGQVSLPVLTGDDARAAYLRERSPMRAAVDTVNALNVDRRPVAFFGSAFATDLRAEALFPNWYNFRFLEKVRAADSPAAIAEVLSSEHARYVILDDGWSDDETRAHIRAACDEVQRIGPMSVCVLRDEFLFRTELLQSPDFGDPTAWQTLEGARVAAGRGATVTVQAPALQSVAVESGREYRVRAKVRASDAATPAEARLQVNWLDADGAVLRPDIRVVACMAEAQLHSMDLTAPVGAATAVVYAVGHTQEPVVFESLSFRN